MKAYLLYKFVSMSFWKGLDYFKIDFKGALKIITVNPVVFLLPHGWMENFLLYNCSIENAPQNCLKNLFKLHCSLNVFRWPFKTCRQSKISEMKMDIVVWSFPIELGAHCTNNLFHMTSVYCKCYTAILWRNRKVVDKTLLLTDIHTNRVVSQYRSDHGWRAHLVRKNIARRKRVLGTSEFSACWFLR